MTTEVVAVVPRRARPRWRPSGWGVLPARSPMSSPTATGLRWTGDGVTATLRAPGATIETGDDGPSGCRGPSRCPPAARSPWASISSDPTPPPSSPRPPTGHTVDDRGCDRSRRSPGPLARAVRSATSTRCGSWRPVPGLPVLRRRRAVVPHAVRARLDLGGADAAAARAGVARGTLRVLAALQGHGRSRRRPSSPARSCTSCAGATTLACDGPLAAAGLLRHGRRDAALGVPAADAWRWGLPDGEVEALLPQPRGRARVDGRLRRRRRGRAAGVHRRDRAPVSRTRAGRTPTTRCNGATAPSRRARSRWARCRPTRTRRRRAAPTCSTRSAEPAPTMAGLGGAAARTRFREAFWVDDPDGAYPAIALDAHKRRVDTVTSNIGHLLGTGLLDADEEALVAAPAGLARARLRLRAADDVDRLGRLLAATYHGGASGRTTPRSRSTGSRGTGSRRGRGARRGNAGRRRRVRLPDARAAFRGRRGRCPAPALSGRLPPAGLVRRCRHRGLGRTRRGGRGYSRRPEASGVQVAQRRDDLPRDGPPRAVRPDGGCGGPVPGEEHALVAPRRALADGDAARLLAQLERGEVPQLRAGSRSPR